MEARLKKMILEVRGETLTLLVIKCSVTHGLGMVVTAPATLFSVVEQTTMIFV